jgi:hypothetical protein
MCIRLWKHKQWQQEWIHKDEQQLITQYIMWVTLVMIISKMILNEQWKLAEEIKVGDQRLLRWHLLTVNNKQRWLQQTYYRSGAGMTLLKGKRMRRTNKCSNPHHSQWLCTQKSQWTVKPQCVRSRCYGKNGDRGTKNTENIITCKPITNKQENTCDDVYCN